MLDQFNNTITKFTLLAPHRTNNKWTSSTERFTQMSSADSLLFGFTP